MSAFQIEFNRVLIERADGQLAVINGSERYLTLSCSHMVAGCRAALEGCRTHCESIQDANGNINLLSLAAGDVCLKELIEEGWEWLVLPAACEEVWPTLPEFIQAALNAEHAVGKNASELQVMCSIGAMQQRGGRTQAEILKAIRGTKPACSAYLGCLYKYVQTFGGGTGAPMIRYLEGFAKEFGANKLIGEHFWQAVLDAKFVSASILYPHVRNDCVVASLICPKKKLSEGFARLLTKTDIVSLNRKDRILQVNGAEVIMKEAWDLLAAKIDNDGLGVPQRNQLFGVLSSRIACYFAKKGKESIEGVAYTSMQQIKTKFGIELNVALGAAEEPATESMRSSRPAKPVVTLDDTSNPQWNATQAGFRAGKLYKCKLAAENASAPVYKLEGMDHAGIPFVMQVLNAPMEEELKQLKKVVAYDNLDGW